MFHNLTKFQTSILKTRAVIIVGRWVTSANHGTSVMFFPSLRPLHIKRGRGHPNNFFALTREQFSVHIGAVRTLLASFVLRQHLPKHVNSYVHQKNSRFNENPDFACWLRGKFTSYVFQRYVILLRVAHRRELVLNVRQHCHQSPTARCRTWSFVRFGWNFSKKVQVQNKIFFFGKSHMCLMAIVSVPHEMSRQKKFGASR